MTNLKLKNNPDNLSPPKEVTYIPSYFMIMIFLGGMVSIFLPAITVWDYDGCEWYAGGIYEKEKNDIFCLEDGICYSEYSITIIPDDSNINNKTIYVSPIIYESLDIGERYDFIAC